MVGVATFIGPFATIYQQMATGRDPGLGVEQKISTALSPNLGYATTVATQTVAPVTTQQS